MNETHKEKFDSLWTDFITLFKGKLIEVANKQTLSTPLANLILDDARSIWTSSYEINGRWLNKLQKEEPQRGEIVSKILTHDMTLTDIEHGSVLPVYCNYLIPILGAGVGYAISSFYDASKVVQGISTVLPAVLLYPAVIQYRGIQKNKNIQTNIEAYITQLDKYYQSVVSVLS